MRFVIPIGMCLYARCRDERMSAPGAIGVICITQPQVSSPIGEIGVLREARQPVFPVPERISRKAIILKIFVLIPELNLGEQTVALGDCEDRLYGMREQKWIFTDTHIVKGILEPGRHDAELTLNKHRGCMVLNIEGRQVLVKTLVEAVRSPCGPYRSLNRSIFTPCVERRSEVVFLRNTSRSAWRLDADGKQHDVGIVLSADAQIQVPRLGAFRSGSSLLQNCPSRSSQLGLRFACGDGSFEFFLSLIEQSTLIIRHPRIVAGARCEIRAQRHGPGKQFGRLIERFQFMRDDSLIEEDGRILRIEFLGLIKRCQRLVILSELTLRDGESEPGLYTSRMTQCQVLKERFGFTVLFQTQQRLS